MTQLDDFAKFVNKAGSSYRELLAWSTLNVAEFWGALYEYFDVVSVGLTEVVLAEDSMPGAVWFPDVSLNYVEQIFRDRPADDIAIIELDEVGRHEEITWRELEARVGSVASWLRELGVGLGDRVVGYLPNGAEAVIAFLATASLGAVWSACGMDYAPGAALGRFAQLEPAVLFAADGYRNGGKVYDRTESVAEVRADLPTLRAFVHVDRIGAGLPDDAAQWAEVAGAAAPLEVTRVPFAHPLWVLFSSGTTGLPKGIVHGHGGVLLEHLKAVALQNDLGPDDRFWWYTTPSWMMWNYQVAGLLVGATIVCYDGSPGFPETGSLWSRAAELGVTFLGTSPAYIAACGKAGVQPQALTALRTVGVTGSTLPTTGFDWVVEHVGAEVSSITGGTDVVTAFAGGVPGVAPRAGEITAAWLGVALDAVDAAGHSVRGALGELVITRPMPSMPVMFWNDPDGARYRDAYFDVYPGIWRHGDFVTITELGGIEMHGRSDNTLNRNGIRMGSADIYEAVEQLPEITEAMVIGIDEPDGGYWMPLFVVLAPGIKLDAALRDKIRATIRTHASPRHVPDDIFAAPGIPHTRTCKKLEVPVKRLLQGTGGAFDPGSVDDPSLIDWYLEVGRLRRQTP